MALTECTLFVANNHCGSPTDGWFVERAHVRVHGAAGNRMIHDWDNGTAFDAMVWMDG